MASRIPERDSEFDQFIINGTAHLLAGSAPVNFERLGLTTDEMDDWEEFKDQWIVIYPQYTNLAMRTRSIKNEKNNVKKDFRVFANPLMTRMSVAPLITEEDREALNLHVRDVSPTDRGLITGVPDVNLISLEGGRVRIRCRLDADATRASMHPLADAIEARIQIGGTMPTNPNDCPLTVFSTKALFYYEAGNTHSGEKIYVYCRYVNQVNPANNGEFCSRRQATLQE